MLTKYFGKLEVHEPNASDIIHINDVAVEQGKELFNLGDEYLRTMVATKP